MRRFEDGLSGYTYLEKEEPAPRIANGTKGLTSVSQSPGAEPAVPAERAVTGTASSKESLPSGERRANPRPRARA